MTMTSVDDAPGLLAERTANEWLREASRRAAPRMLFGEFWLEGELAVMFGGAGAGKSLLAMQIAEALARGREIKPIGRQMPGQEVLYFDLDLDAKQFETRYSRAGESDRRAGRHYRFSEKLRRIEVDLSADVPEGYSGIDEYLAAAIEAKVRETGAKILIFDNINCLKRTCESIREALPIMRALKRMKRLYGLSILVLVQTSRRPTPRGLDLADLPGGKLLSSFADNVFAIGESRIYSAARYLKQIGPKSTERIFGVENVPTFGLEKLGGNFLGFRFWWFAREREHLVPGANRGRWETLARVKMMAEEGVSLREIAQQLGRSKSAVHRLLKIAGAATAEGGVRNAELGAAADVKGPSIDIDDPEDSEAGSPENGAQNDVERWREYHRSRREARAAPDASGDADSAEWSQAAARDNSELLAEQATTVHEFPTDLPLTRFVTDLGKEIWIESYRRDGRPEVWYSRNRQGLKFKHVRDDWGSVATHIKEETAELSG